MAAAITLGLGEGGRSNSFRIPSGIPVLGWALKSLCLPNPLGTIFSEQACCYD